MICREGGWIRALSVVWIAENVFRTVNIYITQRKVGRVRTLFWCMRIVKQGFYIRLSDVFYYLFYRACHSTTAISIKKIYYYIIFSLWELPTFESFPEKKTRINLEITRPRAFECRKNLILWSLCLKKNKKNIAAPYCTYCKLI